MAQFDPLLCPPPGHTPGDLQTFSFLVVYSPSPGMQKETIPHPRAPHRPHIRIFWVHLLEINKNILLISVQ